MQKAVQQRRLEAAGQVQSSTKQRTGGGSRRNGAPGTRGSAKKSGHSTQEQPQGEPTEDQPMNGDELVSPEQPISQDHQERLLIIEQFQEHIVKKGNEANGSEEEKEEIERLLHGIVSMCHNAAMEFMKTNASRAAGRVLRQCHEFLEQKVPEQVSAIVVKKGILHAVLNNLAQHANMTADMNLSLEYLEKALEAVENPETDQDLLPLAETYLNLANGYSFLNKYESSLLYSQKALRFAGRRCNSLREEIQQERISSSDGPSKKLESLDYQLSDFIAIKIMSHQCVGEQHEKLGNFNAAIKSYAEGKQFAENNFGIKHPLYTKCANAMGGARLKSKYQTKEVYRNVEGGSQTTEDLKKPPVARVQKKKGSNTKAGRKQSSDQQPIQSKLMAKRLQGRNDSERKSRRDIKGAVKKAEVRMSNMHNKVHQDNLLLANCDSWAAMHCRHPRPHSKQSLAVNMEKNRNKNRSLHRSASVQSEKKNARQSRLRSSMKSSSIKQERDERHDMSIRTEVIQPADAQSEIFQIDHNKTSQSVMEVVDNKSDGHSCMMQQTERIHQQQMQSMRTMQEDQFKMLQLVMENQQSSQSQQQQNVQQQQQYMLYPQYMQQQQYPQQQMGYYPPQFQNQQQQAQYYQQYYNQGGVQYTDGESATETELSDAEQIKPGIQKQQSEISRAEQLEQAYQLQQQEMAEKMEEMQKRMIEMQQQLIETKQKEEMNAQAQQLKNIQESRSVRESLSSDKHISQKESKEASSVRESELNDRSTIFYDKSVKKDVETQRIITKDVSAQAFESVKSQSILKKGTTKKFVEYDQVALNESHRRDQSLDRESAGNRSHNSGYSYHKSATKSRGQSMKSYQSSLKSEQSFRVPLPKMSKTEAAIIIQKNYRRFRSMKDFKLIVSRAGKKKFLFKATVSGEPPKILTCSMAKSPSGRIVGLNFVLSLQRSTRKQKIDVDLTEFDIYDASNMKNNVLRIIRDALSQDDLHFAITASFKSSLAKEILSGELKEEKLQMPQQPAEQIAAPSVDRMLDINAEIERIRKRCDVKLLVDVDEVVVQCQKHKMDNFEDGLEEQRIKYTAVDPDDEENVKYIQLSQVKIRRNNEQKDQKGNTGQLNDSDSDDSQHDYQFILGQGTVQTFTKLNVAKVVKIQAQVRGFLERRNHRGAVVLYNKTLIKDNQFVRFMLVKKKINQFNLSAIMRKQSKVKHLIKLPFQDRDLLENPKLFESHLKFAMENDYITELDLVEFESESEPTLSSIQPSVVNPFNPDEHLFITDFQPNNTYGDTLIKSWFLQDAKNTYPVQFFQTNDANGTYYKFVVNHGAEDRYIKLQKLPEDILYMAYYFNETIKVELDANNIMQYPYQQKIANKYEFKARMKELEKLVFGSTRGSKTRGQSGQPSTRYRRENNLNAGDKSPRINIKRMDTGVKARDFDIERKGQHYQVEVYDEIKTNSRYVIYVQNKANASDRDILHMKEANYSLDEMTSFLQNKLKIEIRADGTIDYLSLNYDTNIFDSSRRSQITPKSSNGLNQSQSRAQSVRDSMRGSSVGAGAGNSFRQSINSSISHQQTSFELVEKIEDFEIERNGFTYGVKVQERKGQDNRLQVVVTAKNDDKNQRFLLYHNKTGLSNNQLVKYLRNHLLVYSKLDQATGQNTVDYLSLASGRENFQRSSTMTIEGSDGQARKATTKRNLIQSRANRMRASENNQREESVVIDSLSQMTPQSQTVDYSQQPSRYTNQIQQEVSITKTDDPNWRELTREYTNSYGIVLLEKSHLRDLMKRPIPRGMVDAEHYRIVVKNKRTEQNLGQLDLSPLACSRLLNVQSKDLRQGQSQMAIQDIMRGRPQLDQGSLESLKQSSSLDNNLVQWANILQSVIFQNDQIMFDVQNLCDSILYDQRVPQTVISPSNNIPLNSSPNKRQQHKTVYIQSKLVSSNQKNNSTSIKEMTSQSLAIDVDSRADGAESRQDVLNSDYEGRTVQPQLQIQRKSEYIAQRQAAAGLDMPEHSVQATQQSEFEDSQDDEPEKSSKSVVRTLNSQYYHIQVMKSGSSYKLSVMEHISKTKKSFKVDIPAAFVDSIQLDGQTRINAIKKVIEQKIKATVNIITNEGEFDVNLFQD